MAKVEVKVRDFGDIELLESKFDDLRFGDVCIYKSDLGMDYGKVMATIQKNQREESQEEETSQILRKATGSDLEQIRKNRLQIKNAMQTCREKINAHQLPMRILASEYSFDRRKLVFYFTAPGRIDFRALVRDLASVFKVRIDLHQIGPRDEAKIVGGIAPCGKSKICCNEFMRKFDPITTKMAKVQKIPVHQEKLLGICGQLKCCLKFELNNYEELSRNMPKEGSFVSTKLGKGHVVDQDILRGWVTVRLEDDRQVQCSIKDVTVVKGD